MVDVTIMGAGVFGLSVAWSCIRRGARVRVIDPGGPGAGASGGIVGALAPHVPEQWNEKKAFQLDSLLMAEDYWAEIEQASGLPSGYGRLGRIQPLADAAAIALAQSRAGSAKALWQDNASWQVIPDYAEVWAPLSASGAVIHDDLSARLHPRQACDALAGAVAAQGGAILRDGPPQGAVVWAIGAAGLDALSQAHTRQVGTGVKGQAVLLDYDARNKAQIFVDGLHIIPHADGTVAVGSTTERYFDDGRATDGKLDDIIMRARDAVPALRDAVEIARCAGLRPRTRSRAPMLGAHPLRPGAFIANGGFKIGFGMAPKIGEVMADLILSGTDRIPAAFRPEMSY